MQNVDFIGVDSVATCIRHSKLTKFIIARPGAGKGSIPVFECIDNSQNSKTEQAFKDWAELSLRLNPGNCIAYEMLLYSTGSAYDEESVSETEGRSKAKTNKIKFTFQLSAPQSYGGGYGNGSGSGNLKEEIRNALNDFKRDMEVDNLRAENLRLKAELEEEGEEEEEEDHIGKVTQLLQLVQQGKFKKMPAKISGEDEIPDEEETETTTVDPIEAKRAQMKKDLKILSKSGFKFSDLTKLADLSVKNPSLFKTMLANLRTM